MNRLIATRADGEVEAYTRYTFPYIKKYAEKCDAEFMVIRDNEGLHKHYRILQFYKLFDYYDRIMSIDSDMIIMKNAPNIFDVVPEDSIGTVFEDKGTRQKDRRKRIKSIQKKFGDIGWKTGYINTGVAVFSKCHKDIFEPKSEEELYMDLGYDDVYLGYMIRKFGFKIFEMSYTMNHMSLFSEPWNKSPSRFDSYFIHYAGNGYSHIIPRNDQIKQDLRILQKYDLV